MAKSRNRKLADLIVTAGVDIAGNVTFDGGSTSADLTFADGDKANFGASSDLQIYHDGSASYIEEKGTGSLYIKGTQLRMQATDGTTYLEADDGGALTIKHSGATKLATTSYGVDITGRLVTTSHIDAPDSARIRLGDGDDLQFFHDGSNSFINNVGGGSGTLSIKSHDINLMTSASETMAVFSEDGAVSLYYNNSPKLATTSTGVSVTGSVTSTTGFTTAANTRVQASSGMLFLNGPSALTFEVGAGSEKMRLTSTGLGIGTTSPTMPLSVQAASNAYAISMHGRSDGYSELYGASNDGSTKYSFLQSHSAQTKLYTLVNTPLLFGTNSTERMRIDTSGNVEVRDGAMLRAYRGGNSAYAGLFMDSGEKLYIRNSWANKDIVMLRTGEVGIGTDSPASKLEVDGTFRTTGTVTHNGANLDLRADNARLMIEEADGTDITWLGDHTGGGHGALFLYDNGGAATIKLTSDSHANYINNGNNFGIGTTSPTHKLHTSTSATGVYIQREISANAANLSEFNSHRSLIIKNRTGGSFLMFGGNGSRTDIQATDGAGTPTAKNIALNPFGGNVGIGTTSPSSKLDVQQSTAGNIISAEFDNTDYTANNRNAIKIRQQVSSSGSYSAYLGSDKNTGNVFLSNDSITANHLVIDTSGKVGIGQSTPLATLHVGSGAGSLNTAAELFIPNNDALMRTLKIGHGSSVANITADDSTKAMTFSAVGGERMRIHTNGNVGIGIASPFSRLQSGGHTFSGSNGMHANNRVGISNHGSLTGLMLASTYNDSSHPEYGLVFVQGPSTSSYNVWSISPDGPAKGTGLNFHYGAQDTNIHQPSKQKVTFKGDGNVGIGTSSPNAKLEIKGASSTNYLQFNNSSDTELFRIDSNFRWAWGTASPAHAFDMRDNSGNALFSIDRANGEVGIGQTSFGVNGKLQVTGGISTTGNSEIRQSTNADGSTLRFLGTQLVIGPGNSHSYSYSGAGLIASVSPSAGATMLDVGANSTSGHRLKVINAGDGIAGSLQYLSGTTSRFHVNSSTGDVGIGTNNPAAKLHVQDTGDSQILIYETGSSPYTATLKLASQSTTAYGANVQYTSSAEQLTIENFGRALSAGNSTGGIRFRTKVGNSSMQEVLTINGYTGRVGIGESTPDYMLHVKNTNTQIAIESTTTNQNSSLYYIANGASQWETGVNISAGLDYEIYDRVNNTSRMVLEHTGDVGIGTISPKNPKQRRIEVTPTTTVSSNAWSTSTGSNGGFDVKNDNSSAHAALGAITCAGVYNKQVVEWDIRGNMTANTWYPIAAMGQLTNWQDETGNGIHDGFSMYFRIYAYDTSAGGPTYLSNAMTERIWVNGYTSNSTQEHRIHVGAWMGHAPNFSPTIYDDDQHYQMRIHHHYSNATTDPYYTSQPTIEILVKTARTGLDGTAGKNFRIFGYIG